MRDAFAGRAEEAEQLARLARTKEERDAFLGIAAMWRKLAAEPASESARTPAGGAGTAED